MKTVNLLINNLDDVCGCVWLAAATLAYERYINLEDKLQKYSFSVFAFSQTMIQEQAQKLCSKLVHNPRISQWCNADHKNNNYNYLKEYGVSRRLIIPGECNGLKEFPYNLTSPESIIFEVTQESKKVNFSELISWWKNEYIKLFDLNNIVIIEEPQKKRGPGIKKDPLSPIFLQNEDFNFIKDTKIKEIILRDYNELKKAFPDGLWKCTYILSWVIIESILFYLLNIDRVKSEMIYKRIFPDKSKKEFDYWNCFEKIAVSAEIGYLNNNTIKLAGVLKDFRNMVHIQFELKESLLPDEDTASFILKFLHIIIKTIRSKFT